MSKTVWIVIGVAILILGGLYWLGTRATEAPIAAVSAPQQVPKPNVFRSKRLGGSALSQKLRAGLSR